MDYQSFIGKEVTNKNGDQGIVISFTSERITIRFNDKEDIYNPQVAFANKYLSFKEDLLNAEADKEFVVKAKEKEAAKEAVHKNSIIWHKRVNKIYKELDLKNRYLKKLFGKDFIYPPYEEFKKKYRFIIDKNDWMKDLFGFNEVYYLKYCD